MPGGFVLRIGWMHDVGEGVPALPCVGLRMGLPKHGPGTKKPKKA